MNYSQTCLSVYWVIVIPGDLNKLHIKQPLYQLLQYETTYYCDTTQSSYYYYIVLTKNKFTFSKKCTRMFELAKALEFLYWQFPLSLDLFLQKAKLLVVYHFLATILAFCYFMSWVDILNCDLKKKCVGLVVPVKANFK